MFGVKKIFRYKSFKINCELNQIYTFPNNNILLLGQNLFIYDNNFNLIFIEKENIYYDKAYIINNDLFITDHLRSSSVILFSHVNKGNKIDNEKNNLIDKAFNKKIIINDNFHYILFYKKNNDLIFIPNEIDKHFIYIYDFDCKKNYKCFLKTKIMENPQSNLLLIKDDLFFFSKSNLKIYKLNSLFDEPRNLGPVLNNNIGHGQNIIIILHYYDNDNIIINNLRIIIKYNYKLNQITFRIRNDYSYFIITKNYILGFKGYSCYVLNINLELIQTKKNYYLRLCKKGIERNDGNIILLLEYGRIECFKKSIIKAIIFFILRYLLFFFECYLFLISMGHIAYNNNLLDYKLYLAIFVSVQSYNTIINLLFNYFNNKSFILSDFM